MGDTFYKDGSKVEAGDIVVLSSGGYPMVVSQILSNTMVCCVWHNRLGDIQEKNLPIAILKLNRGHTTTFQSLIDRGL